ncbi:MAG TPA: ricin-type beta-trefoil lectin domain protein [Streptosporangiaceae bacterium]|nr:ricin-type beta-trefoil lectin domain protein [Streptosporangiaceae bacterium]
MPAPSHRWWSSACCAVASLALAGFSAAPAAAAPAARAAAGQIAAGTPDRSNVGATHSPELLSQFADASTAAPMTGTGQMAPAVTPSAAIAGAEQGVDVASYQHPPTSQYPNGAPINWSQVAGSGIGFAGVKATEGAYYENPFALTDLAQAQAAGLSVVAYVFAIPNGNGSSSNPATQADYLLNYLGSYRTTVPIMLDIEYNPYSGGRCYGLKGAPMVKWVSAFDAEIQAKTGRLPIIYTPPSWWNYCTGSSTAFGQIPLWVPYITTSGSPARPAGWANWAIWQYSGTGTVSGISDPGQIDLDQANPAVLSLLDPGNRQQAAGAPVGLQIHQGIPAPGQTLSFTATGLPPGLSISPAGYITGWLNHTGTYAVKVSASDGAGATGSVSFSWTVTAAPNQGPVGPVRFDVAGRCLNDAGNSSANGTRVDIWTCNGSASQRWTIAADQTVRIHGKCLSVSGSAKVNGSKAVLETCSGYASQRWVPGSGAQLVNGTAGKCLGGSASGTNGAQAWIASCNGKANQKWTLPAGPVVSQIPGMCVDDKSDSTTNGNPVVIWSCDGHAAQKWTAEPDGTVRLAGKCLNIAGTASGAGVNLYSCNGSAAQQWQLGADGAGQWLKNPQSGLCLSDPSDTAASGAQLVIGACSASDPGTAWRVQ